MERPRYHSEWDDTWNIWCVIDTTHDKGEIADWDDPAVVARCESVDDATMIEECLNTIAYER
jgi:hypothetical protein